VTSARYEAYVYAYPHKTAYRPIDLATRRALPARPTLLWLAAFLPQQPVTDPVSLDRDSVVQ
jgi:hypothetical protein